MLEAEAIRIRQILLAEADISPLLDLGSSTRAFRTVAKPHIERELFAPLRAAGVAVVHCDGKAGDGIDVVADIFDPALRGRGFKALLCANVLEHVRDPVAAAAACEEIVVPGGLILATVPSSYPYHADPIDSGFRPGPAALAALFARSFPVRVEEVECGTYRDRIASLPAELAHTLLPLFLLRPRSLRARLDRWRWYRRPYRVAIALVRTRPSR
jgi:SAM-dependent methyltransferase